MRYSQPFGTPQPPLGQYPRYINGDPVTGTEGSIPPNTAFDEDQIEICTVITNAGLVPDHGDLTQLWQALQLLFAAKYITTAVVKTVHGSGADFPDLNHAMAWVANYTITQTGSVTFMVAAGKWTYTQTVEVDHSQSHRITVQGAALLGGTPQPGNISVTGFYSATDGSNQIIYLRSVHATELSFTGGVNAFLFLKPGCMLRYLLITGSQTVAAPPTGTNIFQGCGIYATADPYLDGCSFWGFGNYGIYCHGCNLYLPTSLSLVICYCNIGMWMMAASMQQAQAAYCIIASCNGAGLAAYGGTVVFGILSAKGHNPGANNGSIECLQGSHVSCQIGSEVKTCNTAGVIVVGGADFLGNGMTVSGINGWGLNCWGNCTCWSNNSTFSNNTYGSAHASAAAYIELLGSTLGAGSSGATVPAVNTMAADGAYIAH
ncbi:MAG: hypothetical protein J2P55_08930 [Rhizobiales bacterium]|nr:hypothetical protein [Hyphomicrobiales bacterium]